jgi:hypothetical protein
MSTFNTQLRSLLVDTKLSALLQDQKVVALRQDSSVEQALSVSPPDV